MDDFHGKQKSKRVDTVGTASWRRVLHTWRNHKVQKELIPEKVRTKIGGQSWEDHYIYSLPNSP